jgi:hypothetical protein
MSRKLVSNEMWIGFDFSLSSVYGYTIQDKLRAGLVVGKMQA